MFTAFVIMGLFGMLATHALGRRDSPMPPLTPPNTTQYKMADWVPYIKAMLPPNIPLTFICNWIQVESGWNPCAIGVPGAKGPDGYPKEQGLAQIFNPDDMKLFQIPSGALRKYCAPDGSGKCTRPLTHEEMQYQVQCAIRSVLQAVKSASNILTASQAKWDPTSEAFWALVKLTHALPGLAKGMVAVTKHLGHPASGWNEFKKTVLDGLKLDANTESYRSGYARWFRNAENVAQGSGPSIA